MAELRDAGRTKNKSPDWTTFVRASMEDLFFFSILALFLAYAWVVLVKTICLCGLACSAAVCSLTHSWKTQRQQKTYSNSNSCVSPLISSPRLFPPCSLLSIAPPRDPLPVSNLRLPSQLFTGLHSFGRVSEFQSIKKKLRGCSRIADSVAHAGALTDHNKEQKPWSHMWLGVAREKSHFFLVAEQLLVQSHTHECVHTPLQ